MGNQVCYSKKSRKELEDLKQSFLDIIDVIKWKKSMGRDEKVPQHVLDSLAQINDLLSGKKSKKGIASNIVFGHPQGTNNPKYAHLIPLRVSNKTAVEKYIDKVNKLLDKLSNKIGKNEAIAKGRIKGTSAQVKKAKVWLKSYEYDVLSTYRDLLRDETLKELNRLRKLL